MDTDLLVVGAGPAGAAAATCAARAGMRVLLADRAVFPRDKCCGDGLTTLALRELEHLGLAPDAVVSWNWVRGAVVVSPSGRARHFPLPVGGGGYAAIARRTDLDAALVDLARAAGVTVAEGCGLLNAHLDRSGHTLLAELDCVGTVRARWAVGADGMWSPLRRMLGVAPKGYRGEWHAFRQYFHNAGPRSEELTVWFEPDLLPGYAWAFPLGDGRVNLGFGIQRGGRHRVGDMGATWANLLTRPHITELLGPDAQPEAPHRAWPIPARVGRLPLSSGCVLFAGDAAGVTDPATGEGIGQALLTGRLAAEAIMAEEGHRPGGSRPSCAAGPDAGASAASIYERRVRAELVADDRMSRALIPLLARPLTARAGLRVAGATDWTRRNFARWLFEDYPRALVATPRRWRRGALSKPGAYESANEAAS